MADPSIQSNPPSPSSSQAIQTSPSVPTGITTAPVTLPGGTTPRAALFIVFLVVFIDLLGFGIVLPLLPIYGDYYVKPLFPGGKEGAAGGAVIGMMMSSFSLMQFLVAPIWGRISDRIGRRPVLLIGLAGSVVFYTLFGFASDLPAENAVLALTLIFIARIGAGIAGATIATAQAVIADCTPPERRKHGMALIGAAFGIGFTFGPLVGFAALTWFPTHHGVIGYAAAGLSLVAFILGYILLPETRRPEVHQGRRKLLDTRNIAAALRSPAIGPVVLVFFLASLGFGSFEVTLAMLNRDALGVENQKNFLVFAYVGFVLMLTQGVFYRRLARRVSEPTFMKWGILLMGLGVLSLGGVTWFATLQQQRLDALRWLEGALGSDRVDWLARVELSFGGKLAWLMVSLTLCVVGFAFLTPSAQALVSRRTDADKQGEVLGVNQSASALARILGPVLGLSLYKATPTHLLPYVFGGILLLLMLPLIPRIRRGGPEHLHLQSSGG
jgi:MFS family permease